MERDHFAPNICSRVDLNQFSRALESEALPLVRWPHIRVESDLFRAAESYGLPVE
jgi:hypothetical protein